MQLSSPPIRIRMKWAQSATSSYVTTPPFPASGTPGRASFDQGFPPVNGQPISGGGIPPDQRDFNGGLQVISDAVRWHDAGGPIQYDATFSTANTGYPKGARLLSTDGSTVWISTADDNETDPDGGSPADWISESALLALFATDTGAADAYEVAYDPPLADHQLYRPIWVRIGTGNTSTGTSTLDVDGLGAELIAHPDGRLISAGELYEGGIYCFVWDGAHYQVMSSPTFKPDTGVVAGLGGLLPNSGVGDAAAKKLFCADGTFINCATTTTGAGWMKRLHPDGFIEIWMIGSTDSAGSEGTQTFTFPGGGFLTNCFDVQLTTRISSAATTADAFYQIVGTPGTTTVTVQRQKTASGSDTQDTTPTIYAVGY